MDHLGSWGCGSSEASPPRTARRPTVTTSQRMTDLHTFISHHHLLLLQSSAHHWKAHHEICPNPPSPQRPSQTDHQRPTPLENAPRPQHHAYPLGPPRRRPVSHPSTAAKHGLPCRLGRSRRTSNESRYICNDFARAVSANIYVTPDDVKLGYPSYIYRQQILSAQYDAGVTKPHHTPPTRTRAQK